MLWLNIERLQASHLRQLVLAHLCMYCSGSLCMFAGCQQTVTMMCKYNIAIHACTPMTRWPV